MKKLTLSILLVLTLACTALLSACNNATPPTTSIRWEEESYTYNVSMQPTTISDAVNHDDKDFYPVTALVNYDSLDQVIPQRITGTYTTSLELEGDNWVYTTVLDVLETYDTASTNSYATYVQTFVDSLTADQASVLVYSSSDNSVTLHSVSTTVVTFANNYKQTPVSSSREIAGYYIGEANQETTTVDITCSYSDNTATVSGTTNGKTVDSKTELSAGAIDASQLPMYARSLEQSKPFETNATVTVYEPITATSATVTIKLVKDYYLQLPIDAAGEHNFATVNRVDIVIDNVYTSYRLFNNAKDTMSSSASADGLNKNTAVMLQSGMYVFQLDSYTELYDDLAYVAK